MNILKIFNSNSNKSLESYKSKNMSYNLRKTN